MTSVQESDFFNCCPLCQSTDLVALKGYENNFLTHCKSCTFIFCLKKPSDEELRDHYQNYPRGTSISPITVKRYHQLLDGFEKYRKTNQLLDLGCGDGHFLQVAKERNWKVYGTEFTEEAVRVCREKGIEMALGKLDAENYSPSFFDVITSFEVIEHVNDPHHDMKNLSSIIRPGGMLYITTPNFSSVSRNIRGREWNVIEYPEHLSYYTKRTLRSLCVQYGFKPLGLTTTGISLNRLTKGVPGGAITSTSNSDEALRGKLEGNYLLRLIKNLINFILNVLGKGDGMKAYFQKL